MYINQNFGQPNSVIFSLFREKRQWTLFRRSERAAGCRCIYFLIGDTFRKESLPSKLWSRADRTDASGDLRAIGGLPDFRDTISILAVVA